MMMLKIGIDDRRPVTKLGLFCLRLIPYFKTTFKVRNLYYEVAFVP